MATQKQKRAVRKILENPRMGVSTIMKLPEVGYSPNTAVDPRNLTDSKGFRVAMAEYGLTEELLTKSLVSDIKAKEENRKAELELGYKVLGLLNPDNPLTQPPITNFTQIIINPPNGVANKSNAETILSVASTPES